MYISLDFNRSDDNTITISMTDMNFQFQFNKSDKNDEDLYKDLVVYLHSLNVKIELIKFVTLHVSYTWTPFILWFYSHNTKNITLNFYCIDLFTLINYYDIISSSKCSCLEIMRCRNNSINSFTQALLYSYMREVLNNSVSYTPNRVKCILVNQEQLTSF